MLDKQEWYCFGCGVGGDVLRLVEFINDGVVTRGQSGLMPESHQSALVIQLWVVSGANGGS